MTAVQPDRRPRLTAVRRVRVLTRRALFLALRSVPGSVATAVHDRWIEPSGRRHPRWRPLATVLFYRPIARDVVTVPGGGGERLRVVGSRMERTLWWYGEQGYEGGEAARWRSLCAEAEDVLEVGANIGYYTVVGARATTGRYMAVEPNPEAAAVVRDNVALNALDRVDIVQAAVVGDGAPAYVELAFPDQESHSTAPTGSYLRDHAESVTDRAATRSITVPTAAASELFARRDLVKLDIEGSEAAVLEAAREEIRRSRPIMLVEVLARSPRLRAVIADLADDGYRLLTPTSPHRELTAAELATGGDVLLVPQERDIPGEGSGDPS